MRKRKLLITLIIITIIGLYITKKNERLDKTVIETITSSYESNIDDVVYLGNELDLNEYLEAVNYQPKKVIKDRDYQIINYDFEKILDYPEFEKIFYELNNSEIVNLEIIGTSVDERSIYLLEIGTGNKTIIFEAGIHATEIANPMFITKFMIDLVNRYHQENKDIVNLLSEYKIVIIPVVNPDGYEFALNGKSSVKNKELFISLNEIDNNYYKGNARGVDLNRNMPSQNSSLYFKRYNLLTSVALEPTGVRNQYYAGDYVGSEPETKALIYAHNKYFKDIFAYITLHSAGRVIFSSKPNLSSEFNELSNNCARIVNQITGYQILGEEYEEVGEGNDGTTTDYMSELVSGFLFSEITGRLSHNKYDDNVSDLTVKACVINVETMERYTQDIDLIKNEYYNYELNKVFYSLIKQKVID